MIKQNNGEPTINAYKKAASTVFAFNDVVTKDASGYLVRATSTTPRAELLGLIQRDVLATDSDYATNSMTPVAEFTDEAEFLCDVDTGTAVQSMVGKVFDLADHNGINVNSILQGAVQVVRVVSTTQVIAKFVTAGQKLAGLISYQQAVAVSEFTDGGSTSGTLALGVSIPLGAVFLQSLVTSVTGFAGDTTAALIIGDGSDTDRYNTSTIDVFTTIAAVSAGSPSGTAYHSAAKTPTLTITSSADFTSVKSNGSGRATITLFWYQAS